MLFSDITVLDEDFRTKPHQYVLVEDERIQSSSPSPPEEYDGEVYPGKNKLLVSGLYNLHTHAVMTLLRGYGEGLPLQRWLTERVFPFENHMTDEDAYWGALLGFAEMIRCGTVSASDMYLFPDGVARAAIDSGMKLNLAAPGGEKRVLAYHGAADGRIRCDANLHSEYTTTEEKAREELELAKAYHLGYQVHLSETKLEHEECKARHQGMTPAQYLASLGIFDVPVTAAHCVWLEEEDLRLFAEHGATVAHCPQSNLKLGSGIAPIARYLEAGISVGIGTDGTSSNNNLDLLEEMQDASLLMKGSTGNPALGTAAQVLSMATVAGAKAQQRLDCGSLKVGNRADLAVINMDTPAFTPFLDAANSLVYAANSRDIVLTMVDVEVIFRDGNFLTLDLERALWECRQRFARITAEV